MEGEASRLTHPVNIVVIDYPVWPELLSEEFSEIGVEKLSEYCVTGVDAWLLRTYYELKLGGFHPVSLSDRTIPDAINIVQIVKFPIERRGFSDFVVIPRGDQHRPMLANFYLEQNNFVGETRESAFVPHWPQPGILPRAADGRRSKFAVSYKGRLYNLDRRFRSPGFQEELRSRGIEFDMGEMNSLYGRHSWNDYRDVDAVLAVRNLTLHDARHKPASKLINAWFGDVPAVLGPEPAYIALRESELDYVEVRTPEQAVAALCRLREDRGFYDRIVSNGRVRRAAFTVEAIRRRWVELINGPIARSFEDWQKKSSLYRRSVIYAKSLLEPASKKYFSFRRNHGRRLLEGSA